jgi:hypothetical protein
MPAGKEMLAGKEKLEAAEHGKGGAESGKDKDRTV